MDDELEFYADRRRQRAIGELAEEFEGVWSRETIERFFEETGQALARSGSGGLNFMPLRAPAFARERLEALAQAEGVIDKERPEVLFLCVSNAGRSQVAAALTEEL